MKLFLQLQAVFVLLLCLGGTARADSKACDGPDACCPPTEEARKLASPVAVQLGVVLVGLYDVNEKLGTWVADFYLSESWPATPDFSPQTEIVNEVSRQSEQFDQTELRAGRCFRSRRIHSTLRSAYNLRTFPFDHQSLTLQFSDTELPQELVAYSAKPSLCEIDAEAKDQLSSWKLAGEPSYSHQARVFHDDGASPRYDYATFSVPVRRHIVFHLTKFFLPLFVIVLVALTVFWIHPEDLNSKAAIGVTCLLAAIAFQLAEAGNLPEVAYLTLADRVYAVCYTMLAAALMVAVYSNSLVRRQRLDRALRLDRIGRIAFPVLLVLTLLLAVVRSNSAS